MNKIKVINYMYVYIVFCIFIIVGDIFSFIFQADYKWGLLIASIIIILLNKVLKRNIVVIEKYRIEKVDILAIICILGIIALRICIPDRGFDILNYHIYLQEYWNANNISSSFFPSRVLNTFTLPLADRMMYFFRYFLGFRAGTILNGIVLFMSYATTKRMINLTFERYGMQKRIYKIAIVLIALLTVCTNDVLWQQNTYLTDVLALPIILEIALLVIYRSDINKQEFFFCALISGIAVSMKVSNSFYLIILLLMLYFRVIRKLNWKDYIVIVILGMFPITIYMLNVYMFTGNPVFPFANSIFKSIYFPEGLSVNDYNNVNYRFGAKKWYEFLLWPIIMYIRPERTSDMGFYYGRLTIVYIVVILYGITSIITGSNKSDNIIKKIFLIMLSWYVILMLFLNGYIRYAIAIEIIGTLLVLDITLMWWSVGGKTRKFFAISIGIMLLFSTKLLVEDYFLNNIEITWRESILRDREKHMINAELLFKDKDGMIPNEYYSQIDIWGIFDDNSFYASEIKSTVPIISMKGGVVNDVTSQIKKELLKEHEQKKMWVPVNKYNFDICIESIIEEGYKIKQIVGVKPKFIDQTEYLYLINVYPSDAKSNEIKVERSADEACIIYYGDDLDNKEGIFVGVDPVVASGTGDGDGFVVEIKIYYNDGSEEVKYVDILDDGKLERISLSNNSKIIKMEIRKSDSKSNGIADWMYALLS